MNGVNLLLAFAAVYTAIYPERVGGAMLRAARRCVALLDEYMPDTERRRWR
jgi:hypothetical protein